MDLEQKAIERLMAVKALEDVPDKDVGKNEPLTLDEPRKMDGEDEK